VTAEALHALADQLETLEAASPVVPHRLTDLSAVTDVQLTSEEMRHFAARRKALRFANSFRSAIVAVDDLHLGYARMFQILNDHPEITVRVFRDVAAAEAWLRS
jgi:hypothetical protein